MDEATTRHRAPSPSNTRKFVEADARSTDLLPKSSTSHARGPSTNFPQVRDEPEFILHDLAGPYPAYNSPSRPAQRPTRYKTLPASGLGRPTRYKTLPASGLGRPTRYKALPASGLGRPTRYKTLPASPKMPISGHFSHAGRTFYRFRHQHDEQGEKVTHQHSTAPQQRAALQISHAIRLPELSITSRNVAIPTI